MKKGKPQTGKKIRVSCAIIEKDGKILATQRSETMDLPLQWEFPGGKLKPGESEEESIVREIREELGVSVEIKAKLTSVLHNYDSGTIELIPFVCYIKKGDIHLHEHRDHRWLSSEELPDLEWCAADVPVIQEYLALRL